MSSPTPRPTQPKKPGIPVWLWFASTAVALIFLGLMYAAESKFRLANNRLVTQLEVIPAADLTPPSNQATWQEITLPITLAASPSLPGYRGWARLKLTQGFAQSGEPWLLVIPKPAGARFSLWLDGVEVDPRGSRHPRLRPRNPIVFTIPNPVLRAPTQLALRITHLGDQVYLNEIALGPSSELHGYVRLIEFMQRSLTRAVVAMMVIMAFFMLVLHSLRAKTDSVFGWYALGLLAWVVHLGQTQVEVLPFGSAVWWSNLTFVTLATFIFTAAVFTNRVAQSPLPRYELGLGLCWVVGATFYLTSPVQDTNFVWITRWVWIPLQLGVGVYMVVRLAKAASRNADGNLLILLAGTFVVFLVGVRDYLYNDLQLIPGSLLYFRFLAGIVLVVFSFVLIRRFAQALQQTERLNVELAPKAAISAEITSELDEYHVVLTQEHNQLGQRINDLLVSVGERSELESIRSSLHSAQSDLQLILDSLGDEGWSTGALLESLHHRLQTLAANNNTRLQWRVAPEFANLALNPAELLVAARLLQSACKSAISHVAVQQVDVQAFCNEGNAQLQVQVLESIPTAIFDNTRTYQSLAGELNGRCAIDQLPDQQTLIFNWPKPS